MRKSLVILVALAMVVAFAVPTMAAGLKVSGKYADNALTYKNGTISFAPGNLYLNFELKEGEPVVALIKTKFDLTSVSNNWPTFGIGNNDFTIEKGSYIAYVGAPLTLSLARRDAPGAYTLANPGEPLGMARMDRYQDRGFTETDVIFKVAGKIQKIGLTGMLVHDFAGAQNEGYVDRAVFRLTTDAVPGYNVGATYATKANGAAATVANFGVDLSGGLPLAQGATMNLALGQSRTQSGTGWQDGQNAYWFGASGYKIGGVTLSGDFRAVDPDFDAVFAKENDPKSMVLEYKGQRQIFGKVATDLNLAGQKGTLTVSNDYRINFDGKKGVTNYVKPQNTLSASYAFSPMKDLSLEVGGSYAKCLSSQDPNDDPNYDDDAATTVYAKLNPYTIAPNVKVEGNVTWKREDRFMPTGAGEVAGAGTKLEGKVTLTPISNVTVEGSAKYGTGTYDFFEPDAPISSAQSRLDVGVYGKAEQKLSAPGIKEATTILAGGIGAHKVGTANQKMYNVGYAEARLTITDRLNSRNAVLVGNYESNAFEPDKYITYRQYVYTDLSYKLSDNSTALVSYTIREAAGGTPERNWYGQYQVKLGGSVLTLSYGANRLGTSSLQSDWFNDPKPWAWLSRYLAAGTTDPLYKLTVTIPF